MNHPISQQRLNLDRSEMSTALLRLGSLTCKLYYDDAYRDYAEFLAASFRVSLEPVSSVPAQEIDLEFVFSEDTVQAHDDLKAQDKSTSTLVPFEGGLIVGTDITTGYLFLDTMPRLVMAPIVNSPFNYAETIAFLLALVYKVLLIWDRLPLHGAAIQFEGVTSLFIGDNGAGKTTISLRLAQLGGVILGEDHILVKSADDAFWVSGMDKIARVTAKTEQLIFTESLPVEARDYGGMQKKQIQLADYFDIRPYVDEPIRQMFFSHVGTRFNVAQMPKHNVFLKLVGKTREMYRLREPHTDDFADYFGYVKKLVGTIPAYDLELSPDLSELDKLLPFLR